jgi:hypothetical protein
MNECKIKTKYFAPGTYWGGDWTLLLRLYIYLIRSTQSRLPIHNTGIHLATGAFHTRILPAKQSRSLQLGGKISPFSCRTVRAGFNPTHRNRYKSEPLTLSAYAFTTFSSVLTTSVCRVLNTLVFHLGLSRDCWHVRRNLCPDISPTLRRDFLLIRSSRRFILTDRLLSSSSSSPNEGRH